MRAIISLNKSLLRQAQELTGITRKSALIRAGLQALIQRESARKLSELGGSEPQLQPIPRRDSA